MTQWRCQRLEELHRQQTALEKAKPSYALYVVFVMFCVGWVAKVAKVAWLLPKATGKTFNCYLERAGMIWKSPVGLVA